MFCSILVKELEINNRVELYWVLDYWIIPGNMEASQNSTKFENNDKGKRVCRVSEEF